MDTTGVFTLSAERPFPGLRPFGSPDRDFFFGRSAQYFALYRLLNMSRFLAVIGNSGSGKSSLVRAGLQPLLEDEATEASGRKWLWAEMRPGDRPLEALGRALSALAASAAHTNDPEIAEMRAARIGYHLRASSHGVARAIGEVADIEPGRPIVLLIDQFEELFRFAASGASPAISAQDDARQRDEAANFVQLLLEASRSPVAEIHVVITMRSDFIGDCARFQGLPEAVSATQFLVPSMTRDQREEVIRGPLRRAEATIEPALVEELLNDSGAEMDQLPVLQHCLLRLWERAGKRQHDGPRHLTPQDYIDIGSMNGALSQHADEILSNDLKGLEPLVARLFRSLSDLDHDGRATRRWALFGQLAEETAIDPAQLRKIIDRFRADDCSFLTPSPSVTPALEPATRIDVGHEALLRHWERVSGVAGATGERGDIRPIGWLREEHIAGQRYQVMLAMASAESDEAPVLSSEQFGRYWPWWTERPRTPAWAERYGGGHDKVERLLNESRKAFVKTSRREKVAELTRAALGVTAVMLIAAGGGTYYLVKQNQIVREREQAALVREGVARDQEQAARQQEQQAAELAQTTMNVLARAAKGIREGINTGTVSPKTARQLLVGIANSLDDLTLENSKPDIIDTKAGLLLDVSDTLANIGELDDSLKQAEQALALAEAVAAGDASRADWQKRIYSSLYRVGEAKLRLRKDKETTDAALALYNRALTIAQDLRALEPGRASRLYDVAWIRIKIGEAFQIRDDFPQARDQFVIALEAAKEAAAIDPSLPRVSFVASTEQKIADVLLQFNPPRIDQALESFKNVLAIQKDILSKNPNSSNAIANLASTHRGAGDALVRRLRPGDLTLALAEYDAAIALIAPLYERDKADDARWMSLLALLELRTGRVYEQLGNLPKALERYQSELAYRQLLVQREPESVNWKRNLETAQAKIADLQAKLASASPSPN